MARDPLGGLGINSKVQPVKLEVAKSLNADWKHPAPATIDAPGARAIGVLGGWTQSIAAYVGRGVLLPQPGVVILAGWPEFGSVLPAGNPGGIGDFGVCKVEPAYCSGANGSTGQHELCSRGDTHYNGSCPAGQTMIKQFPHCSNSGAIVPVPEIGSSLTYGAFTTYSSEPTITGADIDDCKARASGWPPGSGGCEPAATGINDQTPHDSVTTGTVSINNVTVQWYRCSSTNIGINHAFYSNTPQGRFPYGNTGGIGPTDRQDALCCLPPAN